MKDFDRKIDELLECSFESVTQVIPFSASAEPSYIHEDTVLKTGMCVLIGFAGDIPGRMLIDGSGESFGKLGELMFGMTLEGEMLHSFVGEVANMLAGDMCTKMALKGWKADITPPTVMEGAMKLSGFEKAIVNPMTISGVGKMNIVFLVHE